MATQVFNIGAQGNNIIATFDDISGHLVVSGTGAMKNFPKNTCPFEGIKASLKTLEIQDGVTNIGAFAFYSCSSITGSLIIPNSVTKIEESAFSECSGFTGTLTLSENLISIAVTAFQYLGVTGNLTIPNSVVTIGNFAFAYCNFTGNLIIPDSVKSIGTYAFQSCRRLTGSLTISNSLTVINAGVFQGSAFTGNLTIPNSVTSIENYAFDGSTRFDGTLTLSNTLTNINVGSFSRCSKLTGDLTIPNSVSDIGANAFSECSGFTGDLTIPPSVTDIGSGAFSGCSKLTSIRNLNRNEQSVSENSFTISPLSRIIVYGFSFNVNFKKAVRHISKMTWVELLDDPRNLILVFEETFAILRWDAVVEAAGYKVYFNEEEIADLTTNEYVIPDETQGNFVVKAYNAEGAHSNGTSLFVKTIPNTPLNLSVACTLEENEYNIDVSFVDNSVIETSYRIDYVMDGAASQSVLIAGATNSGAILSKTITVQSVLHSIKIQVVAINEIGENHLLSPFILYVTPNVRCVYETETKNVLLMWDHPVENSSNYKIRYNINNSQEFYYLDVTVSPKQTGEVQYAIPLEETHHMSVSVCLVDNGIDHLYSKPILISKASDPNAAAPRNFSYDWVGVGIVEFSWDDIYTIEKSFEFSFELDGQHHIVTIPSTSIETVGTRYSYRYTFTQYSTLKAKVRMVYELTRSAYSNEFLLTYAETDGLPPSYLSRRYSNCSSVIEWQPQNNVYKYALYIVKDGVESVLYTLNNFYELVYDPQRVSSYDIFVKTHFSGGMISEESQHMLFTPTFQRTICKTNTYQAETRHFDRFFSVSYQKNLTLRYLFGSKCTNWCQYRQPIHERICNRLFVSRFPYEVSIRGKDTRASYLSQILVCNATDNKFPYWIVSCSPASIETNIQTIIRTFRELRYPVIADIRKLTIVCIGDSITAGHPNFWAETMTGNPKSQYEYWLNRRLKDQYNIVNKGYGSDTTDQILVRFNRDVLGVFCQFCIIQGGTNDIYWAMAENNGDMDSLNRKLDTMKSNITEMVKRCWDNNITPIIGTLIPRTGAIGIYRTALYDFNEWIVEYCLSNDNIFYIDFFNAGKDAIPPTPLEDTTNPGSLNPMYDGDAIFDEFGNLIKQGRGIHPSPEGYKIMAECIPLSIFKTYNSGFKMYLDKDCTIEEQYDNSDNLNPFYTMSAENLRYDKPRRLVRYIKNIGATQALYALYHTDDYNLSFSFVGQDENLTNYASGTLFPNMTAKIDMELTVQKQDSVARTKLFLVGRDIAIN